MGYLDAIGSCGCQHNQDAEREKGYLGWFVNVSSCMAHYPTPRKGMSFNNIETRSVWLHDGVCWRNTTQGNPFTMITDPAKSGRVRQGYAQTFCYAVNQNGSIEFSFETHSITVDSVRAGDIVFIEWTGSELQYSIHRLSESTVTHSDGELLDVDGNILQLAAEQRLQEADKELSTELTKTQSAVLALNNKFKAEQLTTHSKATFFLNTEFDKFFAEFYIEGLDADKTYCLRTYNKPSDNELDIYIGDETGYVVRVNNVPRDAGVLYSDVGPDLNDKSVKMWFVLQRYDEYSQPLWANTDVTIGTLNTATCCNLDYSPLIARYIEENKEPIIENPNYPYHIKSDEQLRILAIGNSFTVDGTEYLPKLTAALGLDTTNVLLHRLIHGSSTFDTWIEHINNDVSFTGTSEPYYETVFGETELTSVQEVLAQGWDIIVLHQASDKAVDYDSFASLPELISLIRQYAGDDVCFYYHIPYGHAEGDVFGYSDWCKIIETTRQMTVEMGVDKLIPTGTAIQKARNTTLSGAYNLTRDDWHLNAGVGRYIAACTWYEALLAPYFGVSVNGADWTMPEKLSSETGISDNGNFEAVTDENKAMCQSCAVQAIAEPYGDAFSYDELSRLSVLDSKVDSNYDELESLYSDLDTYVSESVDNRYNGVLRIDDIVEEATVKAASTEATTYDIVYVKSADIFAARVVSGETIFTETYYNNWGSYGSDNATLYNFIGIGRARKNVLLIDANGGVYAFINNELTKINNREGNVVSKDNKVSLKSAPEGTDLSAELEITTDEDTQGLATNYDGSTDTSIVGVNNGNINAFASKMVQLKSKEGVIMNALFIGGLSKIVQFGDVASMNFFVLQTDESGNCLQMCYFGMGCIQLSTDAASQISNIFVASQQMSIHIGNTNIEAISDALDITSDNIGFSTAPRCDVAPTEDNHLVNKAYVDGLIAQLRDELTSN